MESSFFNDIISTDQSLLIFLNNLGTEQWDAFWLFVTNKYTTTVPLYLLLTMLFSWRFGVKKGVLFLLVGVLLISASDQLSNIFKYGFERLRPCYEEEVKGLIRVVKKSCGGRYSYFSAHASTGMALATYFGLVFKSIHKGIKYILWGFALFVGYSRIYIGVHYPLDIFTGFVIGGGLGYLFYNIFLFLKIKLIKS